MTDYDRNNDNLAANEDGRRKYSDQEFFEAIRSFEHATTSDIANEIGCTPQNAHYRLNILAEKGRITETMIGDSKVWYSLEDP